MSGATKRAICQAAFDELALSGAVFDISPEELDAALDKLDRMLARWDGVGVRLGYALPDPLIGSDLDDAHGMPDAYVDGVATNLAVRLAPQYGKTVKPETAREAKRAYNEFLRLATQPSQVPLTGPRGSGNTWGVRRSPFFPTPCPSPLDITSGGDLDIAE